MFRFRLLSFGLLLSALALLAGCCVNQRCECAGLETADTIYVRFSRDLANGGFTEAETDSVWLYRFPLNPDETPARDSVLLVNGLTAAGHDLSLTHAGPFGSNPNKAHRYSYLITGPHLGGQEFRLTDVALSGRFTTVTACCTCYENTRKAARLNGGPLLDLHAPAGQPVYIELRK